MHAGVAVVIGVALALSAAPLRAGDVPFGSQSHAGSAIIPGPADEVPGVRIGWRYQDLAGAAKAAMADGKPVVVLFVEMNCGWCAVLVSNEIRCPTFNALAGQAHFVALQGFSKGPGSADAEAMKAALGIDTYPSLSVMSFQGGKVRELRRMIGAASEPQLVDVLVKSGLSARKPRSTAPNSAALGTFIPTGCLPGPALAAPRKEGNVVFRGG